MHTPFFPAFGAPPRPLGRRVQHSANKASATWTALGPFLPPGLLSQADEGPNSRERIFSVRRTFFGFLYQVLKPDGPCREIVRQIQALFALHDQGRVDEGTSAYCQARKRLPLDISAACASAVAAAGEKMAANSGTACGPKSSTAPPSACPTPAKTSAPIPNPAAKSPAAAFR